MINPKDEAANTIKKSSLPVRRSVQKIDPPFCSRFKTTASVHTKILFFTLSKALIKIELFNCGCTIFAVQYLLYNISCTMFFVAVVLGLTATIFGGPALITNIKKCEILELGSFNNLAHNVSKVSKQFSKIAPPYCTVLALKY